MSLIKAFSGLLVTFVCETIRLSHRFRQVHDALLIINHPEKNCYDFWIFFDILLFFFGDVLSIWILDKTRWHMIYVFDHINPRMVPVAVGCVSGQDLFLVRGSKLRLVMASQSHLEHGNKLGSDLSCIQASKCEWTCSWIWLEAIRFLHFYMLYLHITGI